MNDPICNASRNQACMQSLHVEDIRISEVGSRTAFVLAPSIDRRHTALHISDISGTALGGDRFEDRMVY